VSPAVSPDGTRLAYDSRTPDLTDADLWVWSLGQRTNTRLTSEPELELGSLWSPDSTQIAYSSLGEGLFMRPADGTGMPEQLVQSNRTTVAWAWTANDGLIVSEATQENGTDIAMINVAGDHERRPLLTTPFNEYRPALSPNGRWLAYESDESGQNEIYVRPFPEVDTNKWPVSSGGGVEAKWSRDGRTLFYLGPTSLMEAAVGEGAAFTYETPKAVLDRAPYYYHPTPPRSYDVSPDGRRFVFVKLPAVEQQQIIVVTNWVEELERRVPTK
jgi:serine/threonine-protein kinase